MEVMNLQFFGGRGSSGGNTASKNASSTSVSSNTTQSFPKQTFSKVPKSYEDFEYQYKNNYYRVDEAKIVNRSDSGDSLKVRIDYDRTGYPSRLVDSNYNGYEVYEDKNDPRGRFWARRKGKNYLIYI